MRDRRDPFLPYKMGGEWGIMASYFRPMMGASHKMAKEICKEIETAFGYILNRRRFSLPPINYQQLTKRRKHDHERKAEGN